MKAVELAGFEGLKSLRLAEIEKPRPRPNEVLIEVRAAGINYAELELTKGRYQVGKQTPFVMGFEAAGVVVELGSQVKNFKLGDVVTALASSGGYAEYTTADAALAIPIPHGVSFAQASTIPIQGLAAYTLLKLAASPQPTDSVLIQSAAGGVGLYLVQLTKIMGARQIIALASSREKLDLARDLGADFAFDYSQPQWAEQVLEATGGSGVDVVLEAASGKVGAESFKLLAPFGRMVLFGAKNTYDTFEPEKIRQLIYKNQSLIGFNFPALRAEQIAACVPNLLELISQNQIKLFANHSFPLSR